MQNNTGNIDESTVETMPEPATLAEAQRVPSVRLAPSGVGGELVLRVKTLAPALAAGGALFIHQLIPSLQEPPESWHDALAGWQQPFPILLEAILAVAMLLFLVQWLSSFTRALAEEYAPLLTGLIALLLMWDLVTLKLNWMPLPYFPGPNRVFGCIIEDREVLLEGAYHSLLLLLAGYGAGVAAGLISGVLVGWFPRARYWGMPILKVVGPLPATALIPLAMTLSKESFIPAVALIGFAVWFPMTMLTSSGIASVRLSHLEVARTLGAGERYLLFHVALPSALPHVFIGMFMGLGASFLTLIVAEGVGVRAGLGWYLRNHQGTLEYAHMYAALVIMAMFFSGLITLLFRVRAWALQWQVGVIKW